MRLHPWLATRFVVSDPAQLRRMLGIDADEDPAVEGCDTLGPEHVRAVCEAFGFGFDSGEREVTLCRDDDLPTRRAPYLVHTGYELPLLLDGRKQLAFFSYEGDDSPGFPRRLRSRFERFVAGGVLHAHDERWDLPGSPDTRAGGVFYTPPARGVAYRGIRSACAGATCTRSAISAAKCRSRFPPRCCPSSIGGLPVRSGSRREDSRGVLGKPRLKIRVSRPIWIPTMTSGDADMFRIFGWLATGAFVAALAACATGPGYEQVASSIPTLDHDHGRIYFLRSGGIGGSAVQPEIHLNGVVVGRSQPGGFFYVDRLPGSYAVTTSTEVTRQVEFDLAAGQTRYVRTRVGFGFAVGHVAPSLEPEAQALTELRDLHYTGQSAGAAQSGARDSAASAAAPSIASASPAEARRVTAPGKPVLVGAHGTWDPASCQSAGMPEIAIRQLPQHGRISVKEGDYTIGKSRLCTGKIAHGALVSYVPDANFIGIDHVSYVSSSAPGVVKAVAIEVVTP